MDTANTAIDEQAGTRRVTRAVEAATAPPATRARTDRAAADAPARARLTFDQFLLGQVPLLLAVALIFSVIAYAAATNMPVGNSPSGGGTAAGAAQAGGAAAGGAALDAPITAFSTGAAAQQIPIAADLSGASKWDRASYEAQAGDVTFVVSNKSSSTHNFAVEGPNVSAQGPNFGSNTTNTYTLKGLKPGEYLIVCNFPGHRSAGMVAKLTVR